MLDLTVESARSTLLRLARATAQLEPPFAVIDVGALRYNALDLTRRAAGVPIRLASKSIRCREITRAVLDLPGYHGVLAFTLPEAIWLARTDPQTYTDLVVGYPSTDRAALRQLAGDADLARRITLMVDSPEHLDFLTSTLVGGASERAELRLCIDLDASLRLLGGRVHLGTRRSPTHSPEQAAELARRIAATPGVRLVGLMSYEAQIAGVGDDQPGPVRARVPIRLMQRASTRELRTRRAAAVAAVRAVTALEFVNGGGTGSLEYTAGDPSVTELAAGSGLYAPTLFDGYRAFDPAPAAFFVLNVVRRPGEGYATALGGGWIASGAAGADRLPTPVWPTGLRLTPREGAGEVQTPLQGGDALRIGDRVWFRHTKAGELSEHVNELHLIDGDQVVATVPTYRGEGHAFL